MSEKANAINVYTCPACLWKLVTINRHDGTTPFLIDCENCKDEAGLAQSCWYQCDQSLTPTHEWYRPITAGERRKLTDPNVRDHVNNGGLLLRPITAGAKSLYTRRAARPVSTPAPKNDRHE